MRRLPLPIIWIYSMMMSFARKVTFYNMDAPIANEFINIIAQRQPRFII